MHEWRQITRDPCILDIVEHCHLDIDTRNIEHLFLEDTQYYLDKQQHKFIDEIVKLLGLKVMVETTRQKEQIISPIFLRGKKTGDFRMVLNLKEGKCSYKLRTV